MDTIILKEKDFKNGVYCGEIDLTNIQGNLKIEGGGLYNFNNSIFADGSIFAEGSISSGGSIYVKGSILAKGGILKASKGITTGLKIYAKKTIECGARIFAGVAPYSWVGEEDKEIRCEKLLRGEVAYGNLIETGKRSKIKKFG